MSKSFKALAFLGALGVFFLSGVVAQDNSIVGEKRATGAIPLTAEQLQKVLTTWPRVDRVNFNRIGLKRINKVRALKGEAPLPLSAVKAIGREVESSIHVAGEPTSMFALNETLAGDLPVYVDNSTDVVTGIHFPPIRDQGSLGACACWASTYYQLSYMTALQRGLDIRNPDDNTNKYSPKWSYNLLNNGANNGTTLANVLTLLNLHGAATWAEFPYDGTDYLSWCLNTNAWRNALSVRTEPAQYSSYTNTNAGLEVIKQLLANGYVLTFNTDIYAWHITSILDNPSTTDDTSAIGKAIGYWVDTTTSGHSMTIVGYNDSIWTDINGNSTMDAGELGALRIANSWGPSGWYPNGYPDDGGFIWLAYDALKGVSAVPGGPSTGREAAFWNNLAYVQTARNNYSPSVIAEFTVNHLKRNQLTLSLGLSDTSRTTPSTTWTPIAFYRQGGAYAFDGSQIAVDGTFVLDFTDILAWATGGLRRFYLQMADSTSGDQATVSAFKITDYTAGPTDVVCTLVPQYADGSTVNPYVEHTYTGPTRNTLPVVSDGYVTPVSGTDLMTYNFLVHFYDADGPAATDPPVRNVYIDGTAYQMTYVPNYVTRSNAWYQYATTLPVGNHNYRFYFVDVNGGAGQEPITTDPPNYYTYEGPTVAWAHVVTTPSTPTGEQNPVMGLPYTYSTSASACHQGHGVQYQFDWGDGTTSGWLAVGVTSAQHTWNNSGVFSVKAQARCSVDNAILSSSSSSLSVSAAMTPLFAQSFPGSTFPIGWTQQNPTTNRWTVQNSANAGGQAYEMRCSPVSVTGTTRLVTPPIDTTGRSAGLLSFKHFFDAFGSGVQLKIQTSPDGSTWTDEAWVVTPGFSTDIGPETVTTTLVHNLNIATTYVAFTVTGDLTWFTSWYVDNVSISGSAPSAKRKVDFDKDGQEDILWRCYGTGGRQGNNVVWFMDQTGTLSPATLGGTQNAAGAKSLLTRRTTGRTYLSPKDVGYSQAAGPVKTYASPMDVGNSQAAGPVKSYVSPMDVGIPSISKQKKLTRSAMDPRRRPSRGDSVRIREKDLKGDPVLQEAGKLVTGGSETMALDYSDAELYTVLDTTWEIAGAGDFDGDGNTDILWRYYRAGEGQGTTIIWYMVGTGVIGQGYPYQVSDTDWRIDRTGDFNGDGKTDILWRYYGSGGGQGTAIIWYMNGANVINSVYLPWVSDTNWKIEGIGDFNGDGKADLLWRYYGTGEGAGTTIIWYMDGTTILGQDRPYLISDTDWRVDGTGYFDGDAKADILWRYYGTGEGQGTTFIWYMDGATIKGQDRPYRVPDTNWRIVNR
jgi:C1A family cysteine protease